MARFRATASGLRQPNVTQNPLAARLAGFFSCLVLLFSGTLWAEPWLTPGDVWLKADIQLLSDAGIITSPISSWPLSWGDIVQDINNVDDPLSLQPALQNAYRRLRVHARAETKIGQLKGSATVRATERPKLIRSFSDTPRGDFETTAEFDWTGERFAANLRATVVIDDITDSNEWRADGSYVTVAIGNWMLGAAVTDRWWGPGWGGSLILSNNARPIPALVLERNFSEPFENRWLSWLGPWSTSVLWGQMEDDRDIPNARFFGWRINFRPTPAVEIGLLRAAQWCGSGRPCDVDTFANLLIGKDNSGSDGATLANEPGNQLAGGDIRWQSPIGNLPYAAYLQLIGEDEAGGFPSKFLGQIGIETWGRLERFGLNYHLHAEFADTTCSFFDNPGEFNCAYNHGIYTDGYRYRGRPVGYATDNDARTLVVGAVATDDNDVNWSAELRYIELNRDNAGIRNTVASEAQDLLDIDIGYRRKTIFGQVEIGIGAERVEFASTGRARTDGRLYISLERDF